MSELLLNIRLVALATISLASMVVGSEVAAADDKKSDEKQAAATDTNQSLSVPDGDRWWFEVQPYIWMSAIRAEVDAGPIDADTDLDFGDVLELLDKGIMLHAEAGKGKMGLFTDIFWSRLKKDEDIGANGQIDVTIDQVFIELGGFYRYTKPMNTRVLTLDALFGMRVGVAVNDVELNVGPLSREVDSTDSWFDPMIGGRVRMQWTPKFSTSLRADVSGFHVGSDYTFNVQSEMRYRFTDLFSATFGYRFMQVQYEADNDSQMTLTLNGPVLGFLFTF